MSNGVSWFNDSMKCGSAMLTQNGNAWGNDSEGGGGG